MSLPPVGHWQQIGVLLAANPAIGARRLRHPCPVPLPAGPELERLRHIAGARGLERLFNLHCLTSLALATRTPPVDDEQLAATLATLCPDHPPGDLSRARWLCLPVLTAQEQRGAVTWFMLGQVIGRDDLACGGAPLPKGDSIQAMRLAMAIVRRQTPGLDSGLVTWPLQHEDEPPVCGGSLALPFALGLRLLAAGHAWPTGVFASGGLAADGQILPVSGEREKHRAVRPQLRGLLLPDTGLAVEVNSARVHRCATLDEAWFVLHCLHSDLDPDRLQEYRACLVNPELFLHRFAQLPAALFSFPEGRRLLERITAERHRHLRLLADCLAASIATPEKAALLADLFQPEEVRQLAAGDNEAEDDAHRWCVARIAHGNRQGTIGANRPWLDLARELSGELGDEETGDLANHACITGRFNSYRFHPEPPKEFARALAIEERRHRVSPRPNRLLGAMYGTLAQNYGFCGPTWRHELERCADLAAEAFGRRYRGERVRLGAYRIQALLDADRLDEAASLLAGYLGLEPAAEPAHWITAVTRPDLAGDEHRPFRTAIVCRLLAELAVQRGSLPPEEWLDRLVTCLPSRLAHPWQLVAHNLGRLLLVAGRPGQAEQLLRRSLAACLQGGETMRAMGLLPMSMLATLGLQPEDEAACASILAMIRTSALLDRDHFLPLVDAPTPAGALDEVAAHPGRYFPFSYR